MLNVTLTILALLVACLLVWFAVRRSKMVQRVVPELLWTVPLLRRPTAMPRPPRHRPPPRHWKAVA